MPTDTTLAPGSQHDHEHAVDGSSATDSANVQPSDSTCGHAHYGYLDNKDGYLKRLRRIEGQVRGLQRMVDNQSYCIDILTQISATTRALQSVALGLLDEHLSTCVVQAAREGGDEAEIKLAEASEAIARLVRS